VSCYGIQCVAEPKINRGQRCRHVVARSSIVCSKLRASRSASEAVPPQLRLQLLSGRRATSIEVAVLQLPSIPAPEFTIDVTVGAVVSICSVPAGLVTAPVGTIQFGSETKEMQRPVLSVNCFAPK